VAGYEYLMVLDMTFTGNNRDFYASKNSVLHKNRQILGGLYQKFRMTTGNLF
jgi:hypothetical protein